VPETSESDFLERLPSFLDLLAFLAARLSFEELFALPRDNAEEEAPVFGIFVTFDLD
jgi:hypothetical protein